MHNVEFHSVFLGTNCINLKIHIVKFIYIQVIFGFKMHFEERFNAGRAFRPDSNYKSKTMKPNILVSGRTLIKYGLTGTS